MSLRAILSVSSIYLALVGLGFLLAPDVMIGVTGASAPPGLRGAAGTFLGIAVLNWLARGAGPSTARNAIVAANTVGFLIAGVVDIAVVLVASASTVLVAPGIINLLFAAAFAWAGRTSMARPT